MARVYIPTSLRTLTGGKAHVQVDAADVGRLLDDLEGRYPGLKREVLDERGEVHRFVNVYVNELAIEDLRGLETPLCEVDEVAVIPAMAGGSVGRPFSLEQAQRYARHIILPEIGPSGQRKLLNAKVVLIGAGGLGSPAALYLAAAGVGTIGIVDFDDVDLTNLQRQILHGTSDIGRSKLESARDRLHDVNPEIKLELHKCRFSSENATELVAQYDLIVDGSDNFPTRYLSNDVCVFARKPNVYGSVFRFEGQATVFAPHIGGPCYRCLFPEPPAPGTVPNCAEAGVLGVLPGIIGMLQAIETIKLIVGIGEPLVGRLLHFDALRMKFRELNLRRDPQCPVCGENPTIFSPIDYEQFCGTRPARHHDGLATISVRELKRKVEGNGAFTIIDVREAFEYEIA